MLGEVSSVCLTTGTGQPEVCAWDSPSVPFPVADFNLYPSTVINSNHDCNSFVKFQVFLVNY